MRLSYWSSDVCSSDLRVIAALKHLPGVRAVVRVQDAELEAALRPWLGSELMEGDLPIPALIDVDLISGGGASHMTSLRNAVTALALSAKVEQIGRESGRERVCRYVQISEVGVSLTKTQRTATTLMYKKNTMSITS